MACYSAPLSCLPEAYPCSQWQIAGPSVTVLLDPNLAPCLLLVLTFLPRQMRAADVFAVAVTTPPIVSIAVYSLRFGEIGR